MLFGFVLFLLMVERVLCGWVCYYNMIGCNWLMVGVCLFGVLVVLVVFVCFLLLLFGFVLFVVLLLKMVLIEGDV